MPIVSFVSSMISAEPSARPAVEFAIEHGFHGVELGMRHIEPVFGDEAELEWLRGQAADHGITYTIHFSMQAAPASHHTERWNGYVAEMRQTIGFAGAVGSPVIVVHPGLIDCPGIKAENATEALRKDAVENLERFIREVEPAARDAGTVLCFENMHHRQTDVIRSYEQLVDVIDSIDSPAAKIVLDVGHAHIHDGLAEAIETFGDRIHHVHLDDARDGKDHIEIGTGEIDMELYAPLMEPGRVRVATMEVSNREDQIGCQLRSRDALKARFGDLVI